jgi:hypothetical protein
MKLLWKDESLAGQKDSERKRDELLLKLLRTPHQPRPKRERAKVMPIPWDERKKRPPSKGARSQRKV